YADSGDPDEARRWLRRGADADDPDAMFQLAVLLRRGLGAARPEVADPGDPAPAGEPHAESEYWLRRAADRGHPQALEFLTRR
ncbi:SEL1-like repeat protein, partial [Nocardia thailandica]|uniref:SEL1-like repeat protein n=1 Tax=Nocardia thailandica TaxID=257275 RepID=UPI0005BACDF8